MDYVISAFNGDYQAIWITSVPEDRLELEFIHPASACQTSFSFWLGQEAEGFSIFDGMPE